MQPDKPSAANSKSLATLPSVTFCCGLGATVCIISAVLVSFGICAQVLVLTTLGLAVPGLLVGIIAALRIAGSFGQRPGMGFVYAGLSMCAIPLLLALVLPALSRPPDPPLHIACRAHMRSIGLALMLYAEENDVRYPTTTQWCDLILPYIDNERTYRCPAADRDARCSYALNVNLPAKLTAISGDMVILFESCPGWNQVGDLTNVVSDRHGKKGSDILFADGRIELVNAHELPKLRWTIDDTE